MNMLAATTDLSSMFQLIRVLLIFVVVLVITALTTKWIAGYQKKTGTRKNLQIIETMKLTNNKYIQIVKAGETYLVVGIGKDEIHMLTTLEKEQLKEEPEEMVSNGESFQEVLNKVREHLPKKQAEK